MTVLLGPGAPPKVTGEARGTGFLRGIMTKIQAVARFAYELLTDLF